MILKKYLYAALAVVSAIALAACSDDEGTDPGHDSAPAVTIYSYTPGSGYNADEDVKIRIAPNSKVKDIYYLSELTTAKQEYVAENGENAYADYVVENGTKIESEDDADPEVTLTGLLGNYTITVVGLAGNGKKAVGSTTFQGLTWTTITGGTMTYGTLGQMAWAPTTSNCNPATPTTRFSVSRTCTEAACTSSSPFTVRTRPRTNPATYTTIAVSPSKIQVFQSIRTEPYPS